jgi:hypothetical protein
VALAVLVVVVLLIAVGLLLAKPWSDSDSGSSAGSSTLKSDTGLGTRPDDTVETPGQAAAAGATVDYSRIADEPDANEVATMFARFYGAINRRDYDGALKHYDPKSKVVDLASAASRNNWVHDMSTTKDTDLVLSELSVSGSYTLATLTFTSHQDVGYGPASSRDDTCDDWTVTYQLTRTKGYRIFKAPGEGVSHAPC